MQQAEHHLVAAGWREGRHVGNETGVAALRSEGYDLWDEVGAFLTEFSGLRIKVRDRQPMIIDAAEAVEVTFRSWVDAWSERAGTDLVPVGVYSEMTVLLGRDGWLYGGVDFEFGRLGSTLNEVIVNVLIPQHPKRLDMPLRS